MNTCFCSDSPASGTYAVTLDWPVGWGDLDSFGHVNNAHYFRYFEHARIRYLVQSSHAPIADFAVQLRIPIP